jgi:uncharacterized protein Yka (UPF0111/DUF47 family)
LRKYGFWKDLTFYFLIESYADVVLRAAGEVQALREEPTQTNEKLQALADLRKEADEVQGQFLGRLDHAFITPLDKEDLLEIIQKLDTLLEAIERAARGLPLAAADGSPEHLSALTVKLQEAAQAAFELASSLRHGYKHQALPASLASVHRIKEEGDLLHDAALKDLGAHPQLSPSATVIQKEAYDRLLAVLEKSADLARLVARLLVKYA